MDGRWLGEPSPGPGWTVLRVRSRSPTVRSFAESMDLDQEIDELRSTVAPSQPPSPPKGMSAVAAGKRKAPAASSSSSRADKPNKVPRTTARDHAHDTDTDSGARSSSDLDFNMSFSQSVRNLNEIERARARVAAGPSASTRGGLAGQTAVRGKRKVQVARKSTGGAAPRPLGSQRRVTTQSLMTGANKPSSYIDDPLRPNHPKKKALRKSVAGYPNPSSFQPPSASQRGYDITLSSASASTSDDTDGPAVVRTRPNKRPAATQPAPRMSISTNAAGKEMIEILDSDDDDGGGASAQTHAQTQGQGQGIAPSSSAAQMPPPSIVPPKRRVPVGGGGGAGRVSAASSSSSASTAPGTASRAGGRGRGWKVPPSTSGAASASASGAGAGPASASASQAKAPPPPGAEVISIDDSDDDDAERGDVERSLDMDDDLDLGRGSDPGLGLGLGLGFGDDMDMGWGTNDDDDVAGADEFGSSSGADEGGAAGSGGEEADAARRIWLEMQRTNDADEDDDVAGVGEVGGSGGADEGGAAGSEDEEADEIAQRFLDEMQSHARAREAAPATTKGKEKEKARESGEGERESEVEEEVVLDSDSDVYAIVPGRESAPATYNNTHVGPTEPPAAAPVSAPAVPAAAPVPAPAPVESAPLTGAAQATSSKPYLASSSAAVSAPAAIAAAPESTSTSTPASVLPRTNLPAPTSATASRAAPDGPLFLVDPRSGANTSRQSSGSGSETRWAPVRDSEAARRLHDEKAEREKEREKKEQEQEAEEERMEVWARELVGRVKQTEREREAEKEREKEREREREKAKAGEAPRAQRPLLQVRGSLYSQSMVAHRTAAAGGLKITPSTSSSSTAASGSGSGSTIATGSNSAPVSVSTPAIVSASAPGSTSGPPAESSAAVGRLGGSDDEMEDDDDDAPEPQPGDSDGMAMEADIPEAPTSRTPAPGAAQEEEPLKDELSYDIDSWLPSDSEGEPDSNMDTGMGVDTESPAPLHGMATLPEVEPASSLEAPSPAKRRSSAKAPATASTPVRPPLSSSAKPVSTSSISSSAKPLSGTGRTVVPPPRPLSFSQPSSSMGSPRQSQPVSQVQGKPASPVQRRIVSPSKPVSQSKPLSPSKPKPFAFQPAPAASPRGVLHRTPSHTQPAPAPAEEAVDLASVFNSIQAKAQARADALRASIASSTASSSSASASRQPAASQPPPQPQSQREMQQMDLVEALNNVQQRYRAQRTVDLTAIGSDSDASGSAKGSRSSKTKTVLNTNTNMPPPATPAAHPYRRRSSGGITKKSAADTFKAMITPIAGNKRRVTLGGPVNASASTSLSPKSPPMPASAGSGAAKQQTSPLLARSRASHSSAERFSAFIRPSPQKSQSLLQPPSTSSSAPSPSKKQKKSVQFERERVSETSSSESGDPDDQTLNTPVFDTDKGKGKASFAQQQEEMETEMAVEEVRKEISQVQVNSDRGVSTPVTDAIQPTAMTSTSTPDMLHLDDIEDALGEISRSQEHEASGNVSAASHLGRVPQDSVPDSRTPSTGVDDDVISASLSRKGKQRAFSVDADSEDELARAVVEETSSSDEAPSSEHERATSASGDDDNDMEQDSMTPRHPRRSTRQRRPVEPFRIPSVHSTDSSNGPSDIFKINDTELDDALVPSRVSSPPSSDSEAEKIAGLPVITWKKLVNIRRMLPPEYRRNCDLDTSLKEQMLKTADDFRRGNAGREIFEAVMNAAPSGFSASGGHAPDVPPIMVYDNEIGSESTPPWEFVYTNEMWHGEGVPPPDRRNLLSCGCVGKCDPLNTSCACAKRQWAFTKKLKGVDDSMRWNGGPFLYDNKGHLIIQHYPIFECNDLCGCDDECPNRVVQAGRKHVVNIVRTENKGWGVFAGPKRIPMGAFIGIYAGELLTSTECEERGKIYDENGRTYLFDIDFWYIDRSRYDYTVDAFHAGNFTRFLNHSCAPNCNITPCYVNEANLSKPLLVLFTNRDVEAHEELTFSYLGDIEDYKRDHEEELEEPGDVFQQCLCDAGEDICVKKIFK